MAEVFLSYARADAAAAARAARELGKAGWSVWFDRELPAHRPYADVIASELEAAAVVLVLWSKAAAQSEWVRSEANRARELRTLVQARLDDVHLPMPFDQTQCADLTNWRGAGWRQVCKSIEALLGSERSALETPARRRLTTRRGLFIGAGGAAVAAGTAGWFWLRDRTADHPSPEAQLLLQKGIDTLQSDDVFEAQNPGSLRDAIALLNEATKADPSSATAWGSLSLAYAALERVSAPAQRAGLASRSRSSAARAFAIDAHEPRATGALLLLRPLYRHWLDSEQADRRALNSSRSPVPLLIFIMSDMLRSVGRCREAAAVSVRFDRKAFIIPGADEQVLLDLWSAGDLQGADDALRLAIQHWPQHPQVWQTRVAYLTYSGRASEALELLRDASERPPATPDSLVQVLTATALALSNQRDATEAIGRNLDYVRANRSAAFLAVHACAALGDLASVFELLRGYYFAQGRWANVAPAAGDGDRKTDVLFQPPMKSCWRDPKFDLLLEGIGLNDYWRRSGTTPDFRKMIAVT